MTINPRRAWIQRLLATPDEEIASWRTDELSALANRLGISRPGGRNELIREILRKVNAMREES